MHLIWGIRMNEISADVIIVGAGLTGGVIARKLAEEKNKTVLIIDRRNHIAGNLYDYRDKKGIRVQKYGPHVLHTNEESVYQFITQYCTPIEYKTRCAVEIEGKYTPSPFNFDTIDQFYSYDKAEMLKNKLLKELHNAETATVVELLNSKDKAIREYAEFLFEKDYRPYTAKQWNLQPEEIDPAILQRVPVVLSYRNSYFSDKYEFMSEDGFTEMYKRLIKHENIHIQLGVEALQHISFDGNNNILKYDERVVPIVYTGAIDELFKYKYGVLPYRSLEFRFCSEKKEEFQTEAIVAYPMSDGYTRITEYTKMPVQDGNGWTSYVYEYPVSYDRNGKYGREAYYPVLTEESKQIYQKYMMYAREYDNLILCGRLAEFKYYNMDQVILRALEVAEKMEV